MKDNFIRIFIILFQMEKKWKEFLDDILNKLDIFIHSKLMVSLDFKD